MKLANRFIALQKRILYKKIYIVMLLLMIVLTGVYKLLPAKSQSADIKVALYNEDSSEAYNLLVNNLKERNSIYNFYEADSKDCLIGDVKKGYAECGYVIPQDFFDDYVKGLSHDNPMFLYITPSSTLYHAINETIFSSILSVCAEDTLLYTVSNPKYSRELSDRLEYYRNSQDIFTIADSTSGEFSIEHMKYNISLPISEIVCVMILFSGLLGLLLFLHDSERKIYVPLPSKEVLQFKVISILTSILPSSTVGFCSMLICYGDFNYGLFALILAFISFIFSIILSLFIRKSTLLEKVLPLIILTTLIAVFVKTLI